MPGPAESAHPVPAVAVSAPLSGSGATDLLGAGVAESGPLGVHPADAVVDLLGLVAYGELAAFDRMAADARLAPDLRRRAVLSEMAALEMASYRRIADRLTELGVAPGDAMAPYATALQRYHDSTEPRDWLEAVTKAYVGDAVADDFLREMEPVPAERWAYPPSSDG